MPLSDQKADEELNEAPWWEGGAGVHTFPSHNPLQELASLLPSDDISLSSSLEFIPIPLIPALLPLLLLDSLKFNLISLYIFFSSWPLTLSRGFTVVTPGNTLVLAFFKSDPITVCSPLGL